MDYKFNVARARCVRLTVRGKEVCWRSSEEGQQNCELELGDGVGALFSLRTVLPDCRDSVDYFARNSRAWRKISWRDSFCRYLYPYLRDRLECPLRFVRFPSCLKLSAASI